MTRLLLLIFFLVGCTEPKDSPQPISPDVRAMKDLELTIWIPGTDYRQECLGVCVVPDAEKYRIKARTFHGEGDMDMLFVRTIARTDRYEREGTRHYFDFIPDKEFENAPYHVPILLETTDMSEEKHYLGVIERENPALTLTFVEKCNAGSKARVGVSRCHAEHGVYGSLKFSEPVKCYKLTQVCGKSECVDAAIPCSDIMWGKSKQHYVFKMPNDLMLFRFVSEADPSRRARFVLDGWGEVFYRSF